MSLSLPAPVHQSHADLETVADFYHEVDRMLEAPLEVPEAFRDDPTIDDETKEHAAVFDKFQNFLALLEECYDKFLDQQYSLDYCIARLLDSAFVRSHHDEVSTCILDLLGRATSLPVLLVTYDLLLAWGLKEPSVYRTVHNGVGGLARDKITRLVHQIWAGHYAAVADARLGGGVASNNTKHWYARTNGRRESTVMHAGDFHDWSAEAQAAADDDSSAQTTGDHPVLHRLLSQVAETSNAARTRIHQIRLRDKAIQILYEVCRVQRLEPSNMRAVDENFVSHLFDLVEETRLHEDEAFNYLLIKLIVALNEQFMVNAIALKGAPGTSGGNIVLGILKTRLHVTKTFGENLIFMLNRASSSSAEDFCMQLLVLKLLYLLFTTKETAHYFYTNDLRVLVDVFIRELSDLPEESESLRHTYLRVLHPLLTHTQLCSWPYKRPQIRRLLKAMVKDSLYRGAVSATTRRLVQRCLEAEWCIELDRLDPDYKASVQRSNGRENSDGSSIALVQSIGGREPAKVQHVDTETTLEGLQSQLVSEEPVDEAGNASQSQYSNDLHAQAASQVPVSAPAPTLSPPSVLDAPRFRNTFTARSAPSSPPPRFDGEAQERVFTPLSEAGEEAEAMAFADAQTRRQSTLEPSWQSQIAEWNKGQEAPVEEEGREDAEKESEVLTIPSTSPIQSNSLLAPPPSRTFARRASHGEMRPSRDSSSRDFCSSTSSSAGVRRAPPAPPTLSAKRREGLPSSSSDQEHGSTLQYLSAGNDAASWGAAQNMSAPPHGVSESSRRHVSMFQDRAGSSPEVHSSRLVIPDRASSYESSTRTAGREETDGLNDQEDEYAQHYLHQHHTGSEGRYLPHLETGDGYLPSISSPLSARGAEPAEEDSNNLAHNLNHSLHVTASPVYANGHGSGNGYGQGLTSEGDSLTRSSTPASTSRSTGTGTGTGTSRRRAPPAPPPASSSALANAVAPTSLAAATAAGAADDGYGYGYGYGSGSGPYERRSSTASSSTSASHYKWPQRTDSEEQQLHCSIDGGGGGGGGGSDGGEYSTAPAATPVLSGQEPPRHRRLYTRSRVSSDVGRTPLAAVVGLPGEEGAQSEGEGREGAARVGVGSGLHHRVRVLSGASTSATSARGGGDDAPSSSGDEVGGGSAGVSEPRSTSASASVSASGSASGSGSGSGSGGGSGQRRRPPPPPVNRNTKGLAFRA